MKINKLEIRKIRESMKMTQTEFGKMLGVGLRSVQNWESGDRKISDTAKLLLESKLKKELPATKLTLEKDGVSFSDFEVIDWVIKNKEQLKRESEYFRLWLADEINQGVDKELARLGIEIEYKSKKT
ncbi:MAG TPA: helix-turn-helix domain-containing protein [Flavobacteriia bacterium]|nr:helix-turn-helix domain-containing protein [Flavobacteriia bacterium]